MVVEIIAAFGSSSLSFWFAAADAAETMAADAGHLLTTAADVAVTTAAANH